MTGMLGEKMYSHLERENNHLNNKDAVKGVVKQRTNCSLIKRCSETAKGDMALIAYKNSL